MFEDVFAARISGRTTTSRPTAVSIPRRAGAGTSPGKNDMNAGLCSRPLPSALATTTLPARNASTSPGTPSIESLRNSSGSQKSSSTRRRITSTRSRPLEGFQKNAVVAHGQILSLDQHVAEVTRQIGLLKISFVVRAGREHDDAGALRPGAARVARALFCTSRKNPASRWTWLSRNGSGRMREVTRRFASA